MVEGIKTHSFFFGCSSFNVTNELELELSL